MEKRATVLVGSMTRYFAEYIVIDPQRMEDGQRLIILDNLPQKKLNKIMSIDEHDRGRLDLILKNYKRYGFTDVPNFGHCKILRDMNEFTCYLQVTGNYPRAESTRAIGEMV
jgi:hypothetical protein